MFHTLVASRPRPGLGPARYVPSVGLHATLIVAAVALTRRPPVPEASRPAEPIPFEIARPVRPTPPGPTGLASRPGSPVAPTWESPLELPDLSATPLQPAIPTVADLLKGGSVASGPDLRALGIGDSAPIGGDPLTADIVDDAVLILEQPEPRYPSTLAQAGIAGRVELSYVVDTVGRVEEGSIRTVEGTHAAFEAAARASVLASRFRPARLRGRPVRQLVRQAFSFRPGS